MSRKPASGNDADASLSDPAGAPDASRQFGRRPPSVMSADSTDLSSVVELNVGGVNYTTSLETLTSQPESSLASIFTSRDGSSASGTRDAKGRYFLDRDGVLFRYVLDYLRDGGVVLPDCFRERERLKREAEKYNLPGLVEAISENAKTRQPGVITVSVRNCLFTFG